MAIRQTPGVDIRILKPPAILSRPLPLASLFRLPSLFPLPPPPVPSFPVSGKRTLVALSVKTLINDLPQMPGKCIPGDRM